VIIKTAAGNLVVMGTEIIYIEETISRESGY